MTPDYRQCLKPLRDRPVGLEKQEETEARMVRLMPQLQAFSARLHRERAVRRRRLYQLTFAACGLAMAALVAVSVEPAPQPEPALMTLRGELISDDAQGRSLLSGEGLAVNLTGTVTTLTRSAQITTVRGLWLELAPQTEASLAALSAGAERDGEVALRSGLLRCRVPKLKGKNRFSVITPDARVTVHGTDFSVAVSAAEQGGVQTCVRVSEGSVAVERGESRVMLGPGQSHGCNPESAAAKPEARRVKVERVKAKPRAPAGTLLEETRLLQSALVAERQGRSAKALELLKVLIKRYPNSPLRDEARDMLERLEAAESVP